MPERHTSLRGKVYVYKRPNRSLWQCSTYFAGKNRRISTKEESLAKAKEIAEDWYLKLRGKLRSGEITGNYFDPNNMAHGFVRFSRWCCQNFRRSKRGHRRRPRHFPVWHPFGRSIARDPPRASGSDSRSFSTLAASVHGKQAPWKWRCCCSECIVSIGELPKQALSPGRCKY